MPNSLRHIFHTLPSLFNSTNFLQIDGNNPFSCQSGQYSSNELKDGPHSFKIMAFQKGRNVAETKINWEICENLTLKIILYFLLLFNS